MVPCEHAERGENCRRTDCFSCGRQASAQLRAEALLSPAGVMALAREVVRVQGSRSDDAVTVSDLAFARSAPDMLGNLVYRRLSIAWAEGVIAQLTDAPELRPGDYMDNLEDRDAHRRGRLFALRHA